MKRSEIIKGLIEENWESRRKFAEHIGIPHSTLQSILERGIGKASVDNVIKICRGLGITADELQKMADSDSDSSYSVKESSAIYEATKNWNEYTYIPALVSAGLPVEIEPILDAETIAIPDSLLGKHAGRNDIYFMRVNGESMNKIIPHNSLIAVKMCSVEDLKTGDIVVYSDCYNYSVKRFYEIGDKFVFKPESTDPYYTDYSVDKNNEDLRLHGKVITYVVNLD